MQKIKEQLFTTLEDILSTASDIHIMTQNQETIILHSSEHTMLSELAKNKQEKILQLDALEKQFETIYMEHKGILTDKQDIIRLQSLVSKIMETKEGISKAEEKNRRLWDGKGKPKVQAIPIQKPQSYIIEQYKKHKRE
ncbi:MAG TPA: hypothetical protein GX707_17940 [Epulopiscium sp.]|nr:hypothetical protein [Candidatus Epulonipiscium sp.]